MSDVVNEKNCEECAWVTTCANARPSCYEPLNAYWSYNYRNPNWYSITAPKVQPTWFGDWKLTTATAKSEVE